MWFTTFAFFSEPVRWLRHVPRARGMLHQQLGYFANNTPISQGHPFRNSYTQIRKTLSAHSVCAHTAQSAQWTNSSFVEYFSCHTRHTVLPPSNDDQPVNLKFFRQVFGLSSLSYVTAVHTNVRYMYTLPFLEFVFTGVHCIVCSYL
jgi:hypothetical protein